MLRSTATRSLLKGFSKVPTARSSYTTASASLRTATATPCRPLTSKRPKILPSLSRPTIPSLLYATKTPQASDPLDPKETKKKLESKIEPHPEQVSTESSVRHVFESSQTEKTEEDPMLGGIKADLETIKDTFALTEVPRESLYIGAAGVIPYAATSLSTVYLAWDINRATNTGTGVLFSPETAHHLLDLITPIQIGYGAVIISFLGAIHWGLEFAGYGGHHSYRRYMYGVVAPAVAWPTIFMPVEYALITQFLAFNFLYFADARATVKGWFPPWYATYRFVLTFLVGASIVVSLVGRGQIVRHGHQTMKNPVDYIKEDRDAQWEAFEEEEKERRAKLAGEVTEGREESEDDDGKKSEDGDSKGDAKDAKKDDTKDDKEEKK